MVQDYWFGEEEPVAYEILGGGLARIEGIIRRANLTDKRNGTQLAPEGWVQILDGKVVAFFGLYDLVFRVREGN
jgi:hypothetical protein